MYHRKYNTPNKNRTRVIMTAVCAVLMIAAILIAYCMINAAAENCLTTCWAGCAMRNRKRFSSIFSASGTRRSFPG